MRRVSVSRINLEILGIAAFGVAILVGVAVAAPERAGVLGLTLHRALVAAVGDAAWLVPLLVALLGGIVFLEINVPRLIAKFGSAAVLASLVIVAGYGEAGGALGQLTGGALVALVGAGVAPVILALVMLSLLLWVTGASLKRVIGWVIEGGAKVRAWYHDSRARSEHARRALAATTSTALAPAATSPSRPTSVKEAFGIDELARPTVAPPAKLPKRRGKATVVDVVDVVAEPVETAPVASTAPASPTTPAAPAASEAIDATATWSDTPVAATSVTATSVTATSVAAPPPADPGDDALAAAGPIYDVSRERIPRPGEIVDDGIEVPPFVALDALRVVRATSTRATTPSVAAPTEASPIPVTPRVAETPVPVRTVTSGVEAFHAARARFADLEPVDDDDADAREVSAPRRTYVLPPLDLFDPPQAQVVDDSSRASVLEDTLASFGVGAKVVHIQRGPSITRYELKPERGVKISRISALADDIALALAATAVRIEAPIPGKSAVGIEVPNANVSVVAIREIFDSLPLRGTVPPLHMALGKDITGRAVFGDLGKMPHLLVAGATGSGKSVCLNTIIASLLVSATPDQVQMLFIDPKRVELTVYNGIPHLIKEVITDPRLAAGALFEMTKEMDSRYERFAKASVRKIEEYNAKFPDETLPYVVIVIDELADLMLIAPAKVETTICRLAQLARATGIHLVVATQRPSVDVITGIIKANIPSRIAFAVSSQVDSRTILDMVGAERLLGRGDMLYLPIDAPKPVRSQGALITGSEITRLVEFWAEQARPENLLDVEVVPIEEDDRKREVDPLCWDAAVFVLQSEFPSTAQLQTRFSIGHPRAVKVMKQLEEFGIVGPHVGTKPREKMIDLVGLEAIADRLGRTEQLPLDV